MAPSPLIAARIPVDLMDELDDFREKEHRSTANVIQLALRRLFDQQADPQPKTKARVAT